MTRPAWLLALFAVLGAAAVVVQSLLARELLSVLHGTELALGLLLSAWLFWVGLGAHLGSRLARRTSHPLAMLRAVAVAGGLVAPLQLELVRQGQRLFGVAAGFVLSWSQSALLAVAATAPLALAVGLAFPLGCRCQKEASGHGPGWLWSAEALGSVAGGLALAASVAHVPPFSLAVGAVALLAATGAALSPDRARRPLLVLGLVAALAAPLAARVDHWSRRAQFSARAPGQELVALIDTPYAQVAAGRLGQQLTLFADGLPMATLPEPWETGARAAALLAQAPSPRKVALLGSPTPALAVELARSLESTGRPRLVVVTADARLARAIEPYLDEADRRLAAQRVERVAEDPRGWLVEQREPFDLIVIDVGDPTAAHLSRFYSAELFAAAKRALSPDGVLALRLSGAATHLGPEATALVASVERALALSFDERLAIPGEEVDLFASPSAGVLVDSSSDVSARLSRFPRAGPFAAELALRYQTARLQALRAALQASPAAVNRDGQPASYAYGAALWERFSSDRRGERSFVLALFEWVRAASSSWAWLGLALTVGAVLVVRRLAGGARSQVDVAVTALVAGGCTMAMNLTLLLHYQGACGALYERLAVVAALFMLGSAAGSALGAHRIRSGRSAPRETWWAMLAIATLAALLPPVLAALGAGTTTARESAFYALFALVGLTLGAALPALSASLAGRQDDDARGGGLVAAMDSVGASAGALLVGSLLLPALGTSTTLRGAAVLSLAVAGLWSWPARRQ